MYTSRKTGSEIPEKRISGSGSGASRVESSRVQHALESSFESEINKRIQKEKKEKK